MELHDVPFGQYLSDLMRQKNLSAARLARALGYQSKTTLLRIMHDRSSLKSMERLLCALTTSQQEYLTGEEIDRLRNALAVNRVGWGTYRAYAEIRSLLLNPADAGSRVFIHTHEGGDARAVPVDAFFARLRAEGRILRMLIVNMCKERVIAQVKGWLASVPGDASARVEHYILTTDDPGRTVRFIRTILPVLFDARYAGHSVRGADVRSGIQGVYGNDMLLYAFERPDGTVEDHLIQLDMDGVGHFHRSPHSTGLLEHHMRLLKGGRSLSTPIKLDFSMGAGLKGYVDLTERCRRFEENRAIYQLRPDICITYMPPDILRAALTDAAVDSGAVWTPILGQLYRIHALRHENILQKKKPTHIVLSKRAMRAFAKSGMQTDHFWGMRPFTVAERIEILNICLDQASNNPYFNLYFLKDCYQLTALEYTYFAGEGLLMTDVHGHYQIGTDPDKALIANKEFESLFCEFFQKELVKNFVVPYQEGLAFLRALINELSEPAQVLEELV